MEDVGQAVIMAGQVIIFVFALSIAVILYNKLMLQTEEFTEFSGAINRGDHIVSDDAIEYEREVSRAEVILAILNLKDNAYISEIRADGDTFTVNSSGQLVWDTGGGIVYYSFNTSTLRDKLLDRFKSTYELSYKDDILIYTR